MCSQLADRFELLHRKCEKFLLSYPFDTVTPGGIVGIRWASDFCKQDFIHCFGRTERTEQGQKVHPETIYDLASLTKPLVTVPAVMYLVQRGYLSLSTQLDGLFAPSDLSDDKKKITIRQLLSHCSGLSAHDNYFVKALALPQSRRKERICSLIRSEQSGLEGEGHCYSDLGYILLGEIIEKVTGKPLHLFFSDEIAKPLNISSQLFFPDQAFIEKNEELIAPTEVCSWTHKLLKGRVHDDNCRVMGGVAGHAGLFGTIEGVLRLTGMFAEIWSGKSENPLFSKTTLRAFTTKANNSTWSLGFDSPSKTYSSSGQYFSENSIGHLGFTGTSFWIDLTKGMTVVLLTNRVNPSRKNQKIRDFRPQIHDLIMKSQLGGN